MPFALISATRAFTRPTTSLALPPRVISTIPDTASVSPPLMIAPWRTSWPMRTSATSRTNTGVPPSCLTTMLPMSSSVRISPAPCTRYCSLASGRMPPLALELLAAMASTTCRTDSP